MVSGLEVTSFRSEAEYLANIPARFSDILNFIRSYPDKLGIENQDDIKWVKIIIQRKTKTKERMKYESNRKQKKYVS